MGRFPGPEDAVFSGPPGEAGAAVRGLSGPADRVSTSLITTDSTGDVTLGVEGRLALSGPRRLVDGEEAPTNKELVLEWSTPSVPVPRHAHPATSPHVDTRTPTRGGPRVGTNGSHSVSRDLFCESRLRVGHGRLR